MAKLYNISTKREYESQGQTRTQWLNVGIMRVTDDGKMFVSLNMFPNTSFYVFPMKPKDDTAQRANEIMNGADPAIEIENQGMPF